MGEEWKCRPIVRAYCDTCGWSLEAPNAHGVGALHARKHRHYVGVEKILTYIYSHAGEEVKPDGG